MDVCGEPAVRSGGASKGEELSSSQHPNNRGSINSPFWKKAVVYDCVERTVKVQNENDIGRLHALIVHVPS